MDYPRVRTDLRHQIAEFVRLVPADAATAALFDEFIQRRSDCLSRSCQEGHITASAWVLNPARTHALMTHHRRLNLWLQLGGHLEPTDAGVLAAALREVREEAGITDVRPLAASILDLDRHLIPSRNSEPAHFHYDVRFLLEAAFDAPRVSSESHAVEWVDLDQVAQKNASESVLRMLRRAPVMLAAS